jgi:hypothetical protein
LLVHLRPKPLLNFKNNHYNRRMTVASKARRRAKIWFWGLLTGTVVGLLIFWAVVWHVPLNNSRGYEGPWRQQVEARAEREAQIKALSQDAPPSVEPTAPGFKEKDIEKQQGDRFSVH